MIDLKLAQSIQQLRQFGGEPLQFWRQLTGSIADAFGARFALLVLEQPDGWGVHGPWNRQGQTLKISDDLRKSVQKFALNINELVPCRDNNNFFVGASFIAPPLQPKALIVLSYTENHHGMEKFIEQFQWLSDIPVAYYYYQIGGLGSDEDYTLLHPYEIALVLNRIDRFTQIAMALCNEVAARFESIQVSLGWWEKESIQLKASSHIERFDAKMHLVKMIQVAMEEALDQDRELLLPAPDDDKAVLREHQQLSKELGMPHIVSIPLRDENQGIAVLTCVRSKSSFSEKEVRLLRLTLDLITPRLARLQKSDRWFGLRWKDAFITGVKKILGPKQSLLKLGLLVTVFVVGILAFGKADYRVEAPFVLKTNQLSHHSSPFDGYIDKVWVDVGDQVKLGDALFRLNTDDLRLQESAAIADLSRYLREEEKARASKSLVEMQIASALKMQAQAKLDEVRYYLSQAEIIAPFDGVVVEGELKQLLGAAVSRGEVLMKVAVLHDLYLELDVDQRDIHEVQDALTGEVSFLSRPSQSYPMTIERIEPQAKVTANGNSFVVRAHIDQLAELWWRPGMSGIAKVEIAPRNLWWIISHRTSDYLRMLLWW